MSGCQETLLIAPHMPSTGTTLQYQHGKFPRGDWGDSSPLPIQLQKVYKQYVHQFTVSRSKILTCLTSPPCHHATMPPCDIQTCQCHIHVRKQPGPRSEVRGPRSEVKCPTQIYESTEQWNHKVHAMCYRAASCLRPRTGSARDAVLAVGRHRLTHQSVGIGKR
jgi:hypothetical protein